MPEGELPNLNVGLSLIYRQAIKTINSQASFVTDDHEERREKNQIATAESLGLKRPGDAKVCKNDAVLAGKIKVISHLVKVETV